MILEAYNTQKPHIHNYSFCYNNGQIKKVKDVMNRQSLGQKRWHNFLSENDLLVYLGMQHAAVLQDRHQCPGARASERISQAYTFCKTRRGLVRFCTGHEPHRPCWASNSSQDREAWKIALWCVAKQFYKGKKKEISLSKKLCKYNHEQKYEQVLSTSFLFFKVYY